MVHFTRRFLSLALLLAIAPHVLHAQEDNWARWWFGGGGGANFNFFSGQLHDITPTRSTFMTPEAFNSGFGMGLNIHLLVEYNAGDLFGGSLHIGYDNRHVDFDQVVGSTFLGPITEDGSANLSYISVEPNLRINPVGRFLHVLVGPTLAFNVGNSYSYDRQDLTESGMVRGETGEIANVRNFAFGGHVGVGYDIPLMGPRENPNILLTPFAELNAGGNLLDVPSGDTNSINITSVRAGLRIKFGSPESATPPPPPVAEPVTPLAATVRAPDVVVDQRKLSETFPLRNYIFFDSGSTAIPSRYASLSQEEATAFREEQLAVPNANPGVEDEVRARSGRQMRVYFNVINVFADRLRRTPSATLTLTGSAGADSEKGKLMAESVKGYMVSTFGIDPARITAAGRAWPEHRSGNPGNRGEDKAMVDAENMRVEISGQPPSIMEPVKIESVQEEPIDNDVVVTVPQSEATASWTVEVTDPNGQIRTYGPYTGVRTIARINSRELLGPARDGRYSARVLTVDRAGQVIASDPQEFRLRRTDEDSEKQGIRYSTLFEFDESKTVETYRDFLVNEVAPTIPTGSTVVIHGHTDAVGDDEYNRRLSQRRCEETQRVLDSAITAAGKSVLFDTYGFGEETARAPFNNGSPEERYYNRTVVIEVLPVP